MSDKAADPDRTRSRRGPSRRGLDLAHSLPVALFRASHPRQALFTTMALGVAAALSGRATNEVGLVLATVLVGQVILGWHNDLVDAARDRSHERDKKPVAQGYLDSGTLWFALACAVLLVVPLSIANGIESGSSHLILLVVALATNAGLLRRTRWSYLPWMVSFALFPAFLAYGGWGGEGVKTPPTIVMTVLAALLGIGVHLLASLPGLVDDNKDGFRTFPLTLALKTGAPRLLLISSVYTAVVVVGILIAGLTVGLAR
jgi:4-hydroxybenzoate polyprenyltransferase